MVFPDTESKQVLPTQDYYQACLSDYYSCSGQNCACNAIQYFVQDCSLRNSTWKTSWRDENLCPLKCPPTKVYSSCVPHIEASCASESLNLDSNDPSQHCSEGCTCPSGTVAHNNTCIPRASCPCTLRGKEYAPGEKIWKNCNTCFCTVSCLDGFKFPDGSGVTNIMCKNGQWTPSRPEWHQICPIAPLLFDHVFASQDFISIHVSEASWNKTSGLCGHMDGDATNDLAESKHNVLGFLDKYKVSSLLSACSENDRAAPAEAKDEIKSAADTFCKVLLDDRDAYKIKLKSNKVVTINNEEVNAKLPLLIPHVAYIRYASSLFIQVELSDLVEVWWDGETRVYVKAPPQLFGQTKVRSAKVPGKIVVSFATKWQTNELCDNSLVENESGHPCDSNVEKKLLAQQMCKNITSNLFADCHLVVDPTPYYEDCLYDLCSCSGTPLAQCFCPIVAAYAKDCSHHGVPLEWRSTVRECGKYPNHESYELTYCHLVVDPTPYYEDCLYDLCSCSGTPLSQCFCPIVAAYAKDCSHHGVPLEWRSTVRECGKYPNHESYDECKNAVWDCKLATEKEISTYPNEIYEMSTYCNASQHLAFTHCEPAEPVTCHNMGKPHPAHHSPALCRAGCICKQGYVLDSISKQCVLPTECPCHHGGQSYHDGAVITDHCNNCYCSRNQKTCLGSPCTTPALVPSSPSPSPTPENMNEQSAVCRQGWSVWINNDKAPSHKLRDSDVEHYFVPCGSTGVSCSKSVKISTGSKKNAESITLTRNKPLPNVGEYHKLSVREAGLFVFVLLNSYLGSPCTTPALVPSSPSPSPTPENMNEQSAACRQGWSVWINNDKAPSHKLRDSDVEPVPTMKDFLQSGANTSYGQCTPDQMTEIRCRVVGSHLGVKETGQDVECSLERGLICAGECDDYEVSVYCSCEQSEYLFVFRGPINNHDTEVTYFPQPIEARHVRINPHTWTNEIALNVDVLGFKRAKCVFDSCACDEGGDCECLCTALAAYAEQCNVNGVHIRWRSQEICRKYAKNRVQRRAESIRNDLLTAQISLTETVEGLFKNISVFISGCWAYGESDTQCPIGSRWREWGFCVKQADCTCLSRNGTLVKPGGLFYESECELCQCLNNHYTCDTSICQSPTTAETTLSPTTLAETTLSPTSPDETTRSSTTVDTPTSPETTSQETTSEDTPTTSPAPTTSPTHTTTSPAPTTHAPTTTSPALTTTSPAPTTMANIIIVKSTVTPPAPCVFNITSLLEEVPDTAFSASSYIDGLSSLAKPWNGRLSPNASGTWKASLLDQHQYLDINLGNIEPVYGVRTRGSPEAYEFVTSFKVMYSTDGVRYSYVMGADDQPQIFRGPINNHDTEVIYFPQPIEARHVRINPHTWTNEIALNVDVLGCKVTQRQSSIPKTTRAPMCRDEMGLGTGLMSPSQISTSSSQVGFKPSDLALSSHSAWVPFVSSPHQWVQLDFLDERILTGISMKGGDVPNSIGGEEEWVEGFHVLYSKDGTVWNKVFDEDRTEKVFPGNFDPTTLHTVYFDVPIKARMIRINPVKWHNGIALRLEVLGCFEPYPTPTIPSTFPITTTTTPTPTQPRECKTCPGLEPEVFLCVCESQDYWDGNQCVNRTQCPCYEPQKTHELAPLKDMKVKHHSVGTTYITESCEQCTCGIGGVPICEKKHCEKCPQGLRSRMSESCECSCEPCPSGTKLCPTQPTPTIPSTFPITTTTTPTPTQPRECKTCTGLEPEVFLCVCESQDYWDGNQCVNRTQCPCYEPQKTHELAPIKDMKVKHHNVGTTYITESCEQCTCGIGGVPICEKKHCEKCPQGLRSKMSESCECSCEPCPSGTKLCPTSNICLNATQWCDGVKDCPDDEMHCEDTRRTPIIPVPHSAEIKTCPAVSCPKGFVANLTSRPHEAVEWSPFGSQTHSSFFKTEHKTVKHFVRKTGNSKSAMIYKRTHHIITEQIIEDINGESSAPSDQCPEYQCVPLVTNELTCSLRPKCPETYELVVERSEQDKCPVYFCRPRRAPDATCNVTGRTFHTFDTTEYKYDVCSHVLATSKHGTWKITLKKSCAYIGQCSKSIIVHQFNQTIEMMSNLTILYNGFEYNVAQVPKPNFIELKKSCAYIGQCSKSIIVHQFNQTIEMMSNLTILYNGFEYNVAQVQKICDQEETFRIKQVSDSYLVFGSVLEFSIIWDRQGNVKLTVPATLVGSVVGLCGYFDGIRDNDKTKPDGQMALSSSEFGDSWRDDGNASNVCETKVCPIEIQNKAWEFCKVLEKSPLDRCGAVINIDQHMSDCVESMCLCLESNGRTEDECKCSTLDAFVTKCRQIDSGVDLAGWRVTHNCVNKVLEKSPLDRCGAVIKIDQHMSDCVESMCLCLESNGRTEDECKCSTLDAFVTKCRQIDSGVDLAGWRVTHNCAVECPHPLVYKECYERVCEPGCTDLMSSDPCPLTPGNCFPGCYCPEGYVREGNQCVKPTDCRDCVCDGFGKSHFLTFDKVDYSFSSNCSYVLLETTPKFKSDSGVRAVVTNEPCHQELDETCVKSITLFYKEHTVAVSSLGYREELGVMFDQKEVTRFPYATDVFNVSWIPGSGVEISIPEGPRILLISLDAFVTKCRQIDSGVDLAGWRVTHNCAVECPHPLVYKECYERVCEPGCTDLMSSDPCPLTPGNCFPGCYCPEGYVREGNQCVKPTDCRDCVCDGFGKSHFLTFDKVDYSFSSNCSYVLLETTPKFKSESPTSSHSTRWTTRFPPTVPTSSWKPRPNLPLLPSHLYYDATQGLCGSCNLNQTDDLALANGIVADSVDQFVTGWKYLDVNKSLGFNDMCLVATHEKECMPPPVHVDPCMVLLDEIRFGRCHPIIAAQDYVDRYAFVT
ncbi:hemocytin-like [Diaphorina citri]|uniref:Hemocytin-like n=1 Tax=Diaphorina citri TaxID=121845 RepID=A0A3Q0IX31_DIACI|nr:hemocytin-like [Diaphorina citri]